MINIQMALTALEKYTSYMYYAYGSDSLRPQDSKNLVEFIDTALQTLIFTDTEDKKAYQIAQNVQKLLNEAQTYALRLNYVLCRPRTKTQAKIVYNLIGKLSDMSLCLNLSILGK